MSNTAVQHGLAALLQVTIREPKGAGRATPTPVAWASTKGLVRTNNQDRLIVARSSDLMLAILADGMGGMREGGRAATVAASAAAAWCMFSSQETAIEIALVQALRFANDEVFRELRGEGGAAVVVAAHRGDQWWVAHAGDARAYQLRDTEVELLTTDDTVRGQLGRLGHTDPQSFEKGLLQFIGVGPELEPHVRQIPSGGRALVLTSDGIHTLPRAIFEWILRSAKALQAATERLVQASEWDGGHDNATVVALGLANGYSEGRPAGLVEFWVANERVMVAQQQVSGVEASQSPLREVPSAPPAQPAESPEVRRVQGVATLPEASTNEGHPAESSIHSGNRSVSMKKARAKKGAKGSGSRTKKRFTGKVPRDSDSPRLPIVTLDTGSGDPVDKEHDRDADLPNGRAISRPKPH